MPIVDIAVLMVLIVVVPLIVLVIIGKEEFVSGGLEMKQPETCLSRVLTMATTVSHARRQ